MLNGAGQMLSVVIAFPMMVHDIPQDVVFHVFLYGGGVEGAPTVLHRLEAGANRAFLISFAVTLGRPDPRGTQVLQPLVV